MADITFTIPDEKLVDFKEAFLKIYPVPDDYEGTENQWLKECIKRIIIRIYKAGIDQIEEEKVNPVYDENIIS